MVWSIAIAAIETQDLINSACWSGKCPAFANSEDPDQLKANWFRSALVVIQYVNLYEQLGVIDWLTIRNGCRILIHL